MALSLGDLRFLDYRDDRVRVLLQPSDRTDGFDRLRTVGFDEIVFLLPFAVILALIVRILGD